MAKKNSEKFPLHSLPDVDFIDLDTEPMDRLYDSPPSEQDNIPEDEIFEEQSQTFEEETWEDETDPYEEAEEITSDHDSRNTFDAQAPEQSTHRFFKRKKNRKDSVEEPSFENELEESDPQEPSPKENDFQEESFQETFQEESFPEDSNTPDASEKFEEDDSWNPQDETDSSEDDPQDPWGGEDWSLDPDLEEEEQQEESSGVKAALSRNKWHILFAAAVIAIICLVGYRILNYGVLKNLDDYDGSTGDEVFDAPFSLEAAGGTRTEDPDGVTTIVFFGNAPFADDRDSADSLANLIGASTKATIYNVSVSGSYLAADGATLSSSIAPLDAFNFYWLTTAFCLRNNDYIYQDIFQTLGDNLPPDGMEAYNTLLSIDFSTVDVIAIMYDGADYLAGHNMYSDDNDTDIQQFTGNLEAGIELIKQTYPDIRIIVMSPTYAYAVDEDGNYVSSDQYRYGNQDVLSTYVIKEYESCYRQYVTFIDNLYGTVTEDNASDYLTDNIHLNLEGRKKVAERFIYYLNYYNK